MTWTYDPKTGAFGSAGGIITTGYSGHGSGRNNPALEAVRNVGPIPTGRYKIAKAMTHPRLGPFAIPLLPDGHDARGRIEFFIHGDNANHNASHGCIILNRHARLAVANSSDTTLEVVVSEAKPAKSIVKPHAKPVAKPLHMAAAKAGVGAAAAAGGSSGGGGEPWRYVQSTGDLTGGDGVHVVGYSGAGSGRNNPQLERIVDVGPIPAGLYSIGRAQNSPHLGPIVMALTPVGHTAHNRTGFMIHGDNRTHTASHGCIILPKDVRNAIATGGVHQIEVVKTP